jgi:hypothetical protein
MIVFREAAFIANALMSARIFGRLCYMMPAAFSEKLTNDN